MLKKVSGYRWCPYWSAASSPMSDSMSPSSGDAEQYVQRVHQLKGEAIAAPKNACQSPLGSPKFGLVAGKAPFQSPASSVRFPKSFSLIRTLHIVPPAPNFPISARVFYGLQPTTAKGRTAKGRDDVLGSDPISLASRASTQVPLLNHTIPLPPPCVSDLRSSPVFIRHNLKHSYTAKRQVLTRLTLKTTKPQHAPQVTNVSPRISSNQNPACTRCGRRGRRSR